MFSASDAAFSGFRAGREHFAAMFLWVIVFGLVSTGLFLVALPTLGPVITQMQGMEGQADPDPEVTLALFRNLLIAVAPISIPFIIISAVQSAAVNRMILRPGESRFGYLRLGADEVRQFLVGILMALVIMGLEISGGVAIFLLCAAAATLGKGLAAIVGVLGVLALVVALLVVVVRLSLAKSQTFATGRINVFGSWAITRGHFWPMAGAYLLAGVMFMITSTAVQALTMFAVLVGGGGFEAVGGVKSPDFSSVQAFLTVPMLINLAVSAVASPFMTLILLCPAPEIYRSLTAGKAA